MQGCPFGQPVARAESNVALKVLGMTRDNLESKNLLLFDLRYHCKRKRARACWATANMSSAIVGKKAICMLETKWRWAHFQEKLTPCCETFSTAENIRTCMLPGCIARCCRGARMPWAPQSRTAARWIVKSTNTHCAAGAAGWAANSPSSLVTRAWAKAFSGGLVRNLEAWMNVFKVSNSCKKKGSWINLYKLYKQINFMRFYYEYVLRAWDGSECWRLCREWWLLYAAPAGDKLSSAVVNTHSPENKKHKKIIDSEVSWHFL